MRTYLLQLQLTPLRTQEIIKETDETERESFLVVYLISIQELHFAFSLRF